MHGTDRPLDLCPFKEMTATGKRAEMEVYDEKRRMWIAVSVDPIFNSTGQLEGVVHTMKDITNRKHSDEALRESENKFKDLVEKSNVGVYLIQDAIHRYVNTRCAEIHGYTIEEMIDKMGPEDTTFADDWADGVESIKKREGGVTSQHRQFRIVRKDGEVRNVEVYGSLTLYQGRPAIIGTMLDITDRKRAEEALRKSEERFRSLVEKSSEVIVLSDKDRKRTYVSPTITKVLGYTVEEFLAMDRDGYVYPDDSGQVKAARAYILANPGVPMTFVIRVQHKDGSWRWVENSMRNLLDEPSVHSVVLNFHDITDRKLAEEALDIERQRFQILAYNAPFGMMLEDKDGTITYINPMFRKLFGYTLADIPDGRTWLRKAFPDDEYRHKVIATWFEDLDRNRAWTTEVEEFYCCRQRWDKKRNRFYTHTVKHRRAFY